MPIYSVNNCGTMVRSESFPFGFGELTVTNAERVRLAARISVARKRAKKAGQPLPQTMKELGIDHKSAKYGDALALVEAHLVSSELPGQKKASKKKAGRGPGRPRKSNTESETPKAPKAVTTPQPAKSIAEQFAEASAKPKRGPGRPRKNGKRCVSNDSYEWHEVYADRWLATCARIVNLKTKTHKNGLLLPAAIKNSLTGWESKWAQPSTAQHIVQNMDEKRINELLGIAGLELTDRAQWVKIVKEHFPTVGEWKERQLIGPGVSN